MELTLTESLRRAPRWHDQVPRHLKHVVRSPPPEDPQRAHAGLVPRIRDWAARLGLRIVEVTWKAEHNRSTETYTLSVMASPKFPHP